MARPSVNRITLVGEMQEPIEVRSTRGGDKVASFTVATTRQWRTADGQSKEKVEWHRCVAWNPKSGYKLADNVEKWGRPGATVYVEGRVEYRTFDNREGETKYLTEVVCSEFYVLDEASKQVVSAKFPAPSGVE